MTLDGLKKWAAALLQECEKKGLDCISVTDHHDLIPGITVLAVARETNSKVWVFPGMEITSKSGLQGILLLDPKLFEKSGNIFLDKDSEVTANRILMSLGAHITAQSGGANNPTVTPWAELDELKNKPENERRAIFIYPNADRVDKDFDGENGIAQSLESHFKDQYLLLPNIEKSKHGVFGNGSGRGLYNTSANWFIGGIVGGGSETDESVIAGKNPTHWGNRVVTCLRTSDQRAQNDKSWFGDRLGKAECTSWLKLSEQSTVSIAQALISGVGRRVFGDRPKEPGDRIDVVEIHGVDVFGPEPLRISFTPNLTTLIGGRGTGKSLIISALVRLFDSDADWKGKEAEDLTQWEERHLSLFEENGPFSGAEVKLVAEVTKDSGARYRISVEAPGEIAFTHRRVEMFSDIGWTTVAEGAAAKVSPDLQPLFFLQGQMSSMTGSRLDQFDLTRLIEGPIRKSRQDLRERLSVLSGIVVEGLHQKRKRKEFERQLVQLRASIKQKEGERSAFLSVVKKGLDANQQKLFADAEKLRKGNAALQRLEDEFTRAIPSLRELESDIENVRQSTSADIEWLLTFSSGEFAKSGYVSLLKDASRTLSAALKAARNQAESDLESLGKEKPELVKVLSDLLVNVNAISESEKSRREAAAKAKKLEEEIAALIKQATAYEQEIQAIDRAGKITLASEALESYKGAVKDYSSQFAARAKEISGATDSRLVVRVIPGGIFEEFLFAMKQKCQGCNVREKTWLDVEHKLRESDDPAALITELLSEILSSFSDIENNKIPYTWAEMGFTEANFRNIVSKTSVEDWSQLSVILAEDKVDVKYKIGPGKQPIPILSASPGERAVELLKLALFSTRGPLVIDQPEDDLDNHFLAEQLVTFVHQSKHSNQLIFSSHNANLVVHGDAEVIHVMEVVGAPGEKTGCKCAISGTIDQEAICFATEKVMEGGRLAFEHRRRKYHETIDPNKSIAN